MHHQGDTAINFRRARQCPHRSTRHDTVGRIGRKRYTVDILDNPLRTSIFLTFTRTGANVIKILIDSGSVVNAVAAASVLSLGLQPLPHPRPYKAMWINDAFLAVTKRCIVALQVAGYREDVWFDILPWVWAVCCSADRGCSTVMSRNTGEPIAASSTLAGANMFGSLSYLLPQTRWHRRHLLPRKPHPLNFLEGWKVTPPFRRYKSAQSYWSAA